MRLTRCIFVLVCLGMLAGAASCLPFLGFWPILSFPVPVSRFRNALLTRMSLGFQCLQAPRASYFASGFLYQPWYAFPAALAVFFLAVFAAFDVVWSWYTPLSTTNSVTAITSYFFIKSISSIRISFKRSNSPQLRPIPFK